MQDKRDKVKETLRHPEKEARPDRPMSKERPAWLKVRAPMGANHDEVQALFKTAGINTVCEEANCPNRGTCWKDRHAAFMILGDICTRGCAFCNVKTGKPLSGTDELEPEKIGLAVAKLSLSHVVITSVDRDDLEDGGAHQFARVIKKIREYAPESTIEVLIPDFRGKQGALECVIEAKPDVINHNIETVPRLYRSIRPGARYYHSIHLLHRVGLLSTDIFTKSGVMVGLGESNEEIYQVMDDLRSAHVDFLTIGQYLQPTPKHAPVDRFVSPDQFKVLEQRAYAAGFSMVSASPLTRSSYFAGDDFQKLKQQRKGK